ncbi:hypothetical protein FDZ74_00560 [bacterium]|nr:MAG: hypothetical protein FDZ74_00560 [bacterium]
MTESIPAPLYTLTDDDKVTSLMLYTANALIWGEVVVKQAIRVSTWLRTNAAPDKIVIYGAKLLLTTTSNAQPGNYREMIVPASIVGAYHLIPPASDPMDYDPTEPNRIMVPVSVLIGSSRINGKMRMTQQSNVQKYLDVTHESFTSIYDAEITNVLLPSLGRLKVPYVQVRQETGIFATQ